MTWLRIDDGFAGHPKVTALTYRDRWTWVQLLCYCAKYDTNGWLPANISEHVSFAKTTYLESCEDLGLLDKTDGEYRVHDWEIYAPKDPTKAERQARWRKKKAHAVDGDVDAPVDGNVDTERDDLVDTKTVHSRAGTRRTRPVPSLSVTKEPAPDPNRLANQGSAETGQGGNRAGLIQPIGPEALRLLATIKSQL